MRAVILAGGFGKRLFPYTLVLPKPLIPIGDKPIIEVVIRQLVSRGFDHITIAVGYHAELIMAIVGDGSKYGVAIDFSMEDKPLNTIGPLSLIDKLDQTFLVMNGDLLTDLNYKELYESHKTNGSILTIAVCKRHVSISLGVLSFDDDQRVTSFQEKPQFDYDVSMGVYIFEPGIFKYIPKGESFGFDHLIHKLLDKKEPVNVFQFDGNWLDMGTQDDLDNAIEEFENHRSRYLP